MSIAKTEIDRAELLDLLGHLISINSVNPAFGAEAQGEGKLAHAVQDFFKHNKIHCERQEVLPGRFNVIGKVPGRNQNRCIIFDAHMDTVSVEGMGIEPFTPEIRQNRMYGRGSCDVKAGLASMLLALKSVSHSKTPLPFSIWLTATVDEEHSFQGIRALAQEKPPAVAAVVAEPTGLDIVVCHKGILRWKIVVKGRAAHSSKPHLGINAISKMARLIALLEERQQALYQSRPHPLLGPATLNVGLISGGIQVNLVPDRCEIQIDRRTLPNENTARIIQEFEAVIEELASLDPDFSAMQMSPTLEDAALETDSAAPIVQAALSQCNKVRGQAQLIGVPYATNASKLSKIGIPSIVLGPGNIDQAHTAVEYVDLEQVYQAAVIYAGIMMEFEGKSSA